MSHLDRLLIRGVRAFDPDEVAFLDIQTPLTLIVGHNGAGKTTIIESLKYACTGDLPPNSRSGAFIHDPKMYGKREVKAQVKLNFTNVNGVAISLSRNMSLTQTKGKMTFKTLEALLEVTDPKTGVVRAQTTRCADLDSEIPGHLGVSKPILEHVIFCHQEDSFWPLSEPAALKKRFDEIFAATRYTKALDNIKSIRKEQAAEIKFETNNLDHLKANKDKAERARQTLEMVQTKVNTGQARIHALDAGELDSVVSQMKNCLVKQREIDVLQSKLSQIDMERGLVRKNHDSLAENLDLCKENDAELQRMVDNYQQTAHSYKAEGEATHRERTKQERVLAELGAKLSQLLTEKGMLQAEAESYKRRLQERDVLVQSLSAAYGLSRLDAEGFFHAFERYSQEQNEQALAAKQSRSTQESALLQVVQTRKNACSLIDQEHYNFKKRKDELLREIQKISQSIRLLSSAKDELDAAKNLLKAEEELLAKMDAPSDSDARLLKLTQSLQEGEFTLKQLSDESYALHLQSDTRAQLALKEDDKTKLEKELNDLKFEVEDAYPSQFQEGSPSIAQVFGRAKSNLESKQSDLKNLQSSFESLGKHAADASTQHAMIQSQLDAKRRAASSKREQMEKALGSAFTSFSVAVDEAEAIVADRRRMVQTMRSMSNLYQRYISKFDNAHSCPLCDRGFESEHLEHEFRDKLESTLARTPQSIILAEKDLSEAQASLDSLLKQRGTFEDLARLEGIEIPELETKMESLKHLVDMSRGNLEDVEGELAMTRAEADHLLSLTRKLSAYEDKEHALSELSAKIDTLESALRASGCKRSIAEVQDETFQVQEKCKSMRAAIDKHNMDVRRTQNEHVMHQNKARDATALIERLTRSLEDKAQMEVQLKKLQKEADSMEQSLISYADQRRDLANQLKSSEQELFAHQASAQESDSTEYKALQELQNAIQKLTQITSEIDFYLKREQNVSSCDEEINHIEASRAKVESTIKNLSEKINALERQSSESSLILRRIEDNLNLRKLQSKLIVLDLEWSRVNTELAASNPESIRLSYEVLKVSHEKLVEERAGLVGEVKVLQEQMNRLSTELTDDYKNVLEDYKSSLVKLKTDEMAYNDMEKYAKALDAAIMKYHSLKMAEVNKIIRHIWVDTYKGTDIDHIEIRSDQENTKGNRSYNYRIVMVKGDAELDFRGRCSAGQKMLTCIIVRLALAEAFGVNCGVLALDEPTTNIDKDNISSLAGALVDIIKNRRAQRNFQLIIITHDEDFLRELGKSEYTDYYYRIAQDNGGHSKIEQCDIQSL